MGASLQCSQPSQEVSACLIETYHQQLAAAAASAEKNYMTQLTQSSTAANQEDSSLQSSCRYPQDKMDYYAKYANIATESSSPLQRHVPASFQHVPDLMIGQQHHQLPSPHTPTGQYVPSFSPVSWNQFPVRTSSYDGINTSVSSSSSAASKGSALSSPTIYPPTPPPSAPWIHPWFGGDTF